MHPRNYDRPHLVEALKSKFVQEISCGSSHSAAVMSTGELFTWGLGEYGRLGHGDNQTQLRPKQVRCAANRNGLAVLYTEPFGLLPQTLRSTTGTTVAYRVFSLTWPASIQIYWNKRKRLHKKGVQLPQDWLGTPTWPPFNCLGTPIWPP